MISERDAKRAKRLASWNALAPTVLEGDLFTHACPECPRWFSNAGGLARHMPTHVEFSPLLVRRLFLDPGWCYVSHVHQTKRSVAHIATKTGPSSHGSILCGTRAPMTRETVKPPHSVCETCLPIYWKETA